MEKRNLFLVSLVAALILAFGNCSSGETKQEGSVTTKCLKGNCKSETSTLEFSDGNKYEGGFKDSKFDGDGTFTFANGDVYKGKFASDKFNGKGNYKFANGDVYDGDFKDDLFDGKGVLTKKNGNKYEGDFKSGKQNGDGILTQPDGDTFKGSFKEDAPVKGVIKDKSGRVVFEGDLEAEAKKALEAKLKKM
ncbi:MAG: hypothetical protein SFU98_18960 [Leptospiraceae bacterium]|nr:hypothetical protein [Leptospiraceae bacterium]